MRINHFFHSSLLQGCENKTTIDTSEPYVGAMKGTMREPQANLGAGQKFSPVDVFKQKKGGDKLEDFNGLVKHQTTPLSSLQNGQVTQINLTNKSDYN